ncbi:MAG TPA: class I SAM-dependent methyltransferase, partial [Allosphingosinicella sp.]|uniref:class I SAM-dependent methyltransferase n=1 Tax=Allosphingosinicella sp. TaxID=2823234 RepID=UPI002ED8F55C
MWLLGKFLNRVVRKGELIVIDADGREHRFGSRDPERPPVAFRLTDRRAAFDIVSDPRLGAAEAYMDGRLVMERGEILDLLDLIRSNARWERGANLGKNRAKRLLRKVDQVNWERRSKRNVAHHYDVGNALYDLFLDEDRQYTCAYFLNPDDSLEQAQLDKKAHLAAKLNIKPGMRVL